MAQRSVTTLQLKSPAFPYNGPIPQNYTCDGDDINPPLFISSNHPKTHSLALIVEDPDAPTKPFTHWVLWNIAPTTYEIKENSLPPGSIEGHNGFGLIGYRGPCPPLGNHRYHFQLYALDTQLTLPRGSTKTQLQAAMKDHILEKTLLVGQYSRPL
jgi:Raf kinase inhibitor-like YbhB/YbcL family protein